MMERVRRTLGLVVLLGLVAMLGIVGAPAVADAACQQTDILAETIARTCWECIFPVSLAGATMQSEDQPATDPAKGQTAGLCFCCTGGEACPPSVPFGYWDPVRLVEVVREPFCFPSLGGMDVGGETDAEGRGSVSQTGEPALDYAFYQVHFIQFPLFAILDLVVDAFCQNTTQVVDQIDVLYLSELDPLWHDDVAATVSAPEAALIANPVTVAACAADAIAATAGFPQDELWWCAGSWGTLYPPTGNMAGGNTGPVKASALAMARLLAHLSRLGSEMYTAGNEDQICYDYPTFLIVKSQYKFQLMWPIANTGPQCCSPLGRTTMLWGMGKLVPGEGEDFVYLLWKNQNCCLRLGL